jgi:CarboxypepD_reg-like domain
MSQIFTNKEVIKFYIARISIKTVLLLIVLFSAGTIYSQSLKGKVLSNSTQKGIGFVNVVIVGKNIGTVSDEYGNFTIALVNIFNSDSLRFSMIGYESKTFSILQFKQDSSKKVFMDLKVYKLLEVNVIHKKGRKPKEIIIGTPVVSNDLKSGFENNNLGSELGIKVNVKQGVLLKDLNLNVATCTFDSVTYRLNIYQSENEIEYKNILTEPIYISFSKDKIKNVITYDLRKYSIIVKGNILIALELYKDLGEGSLLFHTEFFTGFTFHRKTIDGNWIKSPGLIGMYLNGHIINY